MQAKCVFSLCSWHGEGHCGPNQLWWATDRDWHRARGPALGGLPKPGSGRKKPQRAEMCLPGAFS